MKFQVLPKWYFFKYLRFFKEKEAAVFTDEFSENISKTILTFNGLFCSPPPSLPYFNHYIFHNLHNSLVIFYFI